MLVTLKVSKIRDTVDQIGKGGRFVLLAGVVQYGHGRVIFVYKKQKVLISYFYIKIYNWRSQIG